MYEYALSSIEESEEEYSTAKNETWKNQTRYLFHCVI